MTTPSSGAISAQDVATEFGLGHPIAFSQFYGLGGASGSGAISLGDMRGRSNATFNPSGSTASGAAASPASPSVTLTCSVSAVWTFTLPSGVSATLANGQSGTSAIFTRTAVGSTSFSVTAAAGGTSHVWTVTLNKINVP